MRTTKTHQALTFAALALTLVWATAASAGDFYIFGKWHEQRGIQAIPVKNAGQIFAVNGAQAHTLGGPKNTVTFDTSAFTRQPQSFSNYLGHYVTTLVQLATSFSAQGPQSSNRTVHTGPKTSRGDNFSACPAQGLLTGCTAGMQSPVVQKDGRLTYTKAGNQMGGVMQMLLGGSGTLTKKIGDGTSPGYDCPNRGANATSCPIVNHSGIGGGSNPQLPGKTLGGSGDIILAPGPSAQVTQTGLCYTGAQKGCIKGSIALGGVTGGATIKNWGAPFTQGDIRGSVALGRGFVASTLTGMGSDNRTAGGSGNLTLVAGGISNRYDAGTSYVMIDKISARMVSDAVVTGSPSMGPAGLATFTALLALAGGYSLRRRSRREN